ncbi:RNA 2',3'-cyclic phosphodiesterase [Catellatospora tritici]|uniref:RNA 2',3'-cyclic phosphodiesterase n=1 Tax=Catellatospora tritici TaxID=2851566 RepID=UPI001C2CDE0B|nr:RNA 2',3'-cyclic phosphodiesterase [Catellatospora tritici]MBV1852710.1 RNA 2',3'-cyclic phosphodiesterase [Catellatospora tritici]
MLKQRLFIAVYPPPAAVADLAAVASQLAFNRPHPDGLSLRPVPPWQWHITLAFLGEITPAQAGSACAAMTAAAQRPAPVLSLGGGGRFDNGRAAAVWTGVRGDLAGLHDLAERLRAALTAAEVPFDPRPYQPHLTLARPGERLEPDELRDVLDRLDAYAGPAWPADRVVLMRSDHPVSHDYTEVFAAPLAR